MKKSSPIYQGMNRDIPASIIQGLNRALEKGRGDQGSVTVYLRADDGGIPSQNWALLSQLFIAHSMPLNIALVPTWLTQARWAAITSQTHAAGSMFCWHQHGWRHVNHESQGKKHEFGPSRQKKQIFEDLTKGRQRLDAIIGNRFYPAFTPPWNRCSDATIELLKSNGYKALSRDIPLDKLPNDVIISEFPVHLDLHTRKDKTQEQAWIDFFKDLETGLKTGRCGIMIHHMRMDAGAFNFLDRFLSEIKTKKWIHPLTFKEMD